MRHSAAKIGRRELQTRGNPQDDVSALIQCETFVTTHEIPVAGVAQIAAGQIYPETPAEEVVIERGVSMKQRVTISGRIECAQAILSVYEFRLGTHLEGIRPAQLGEPEVPTHETT